MKTTPKSPESRMDTMYGSVVTTPGGTVASGDLVHAASEFQDVLEGLARTEGRFVASAVLVLALLLGIVILPVVVGRFRTFLGRKAQTGWATRATDRLTTYIPTSFAGLLLRTSQLAVLVGISTAFLVVWGVLDLSTALEDLLEAAGPNLYDGVVTLLVVAVAFVISDQLQRMISGFNRRVESMTEHQEEILVRVGQVAIFVTAGASILTVWSVDISGLLIGAGFLGIVVGFAARKTLGSLIAGFVLMFSRPFTIGDWVEIGDMEGIVTEITLFNTRLENFDGEFIVLPNDQVSDVPITNRSTKGLLRLRTDVSVDYGTDVDHARTVAMAAMESVEEVVSSPSPQVVPREFGDNGIILELRYWIDHPMPPRRWGAVSAVIEAVKRGFDDEEIQITYPHRELSLSANSSREAINAELHADGASDDTGNGQASDASAPDAET